MANMMAALKGLAKAGTPAKGPKVIDLGKAKAAKKAGK